MEQDFKSIIKWFYLQTISFVLKVANGGLTNVIYLTCQNYKFFCDTINRYKTIASISTTEYKVPVYGHNCINLPNSCMVDNKQLTPVFIV